MIVSALASEGEWVYAVGNDFSGPDYGPTSILAYAWTGDRACKVHDAGRLVEDVQVHDGYLVWMEYAGTAGLEYRILGLPLPSGQPRPPADVRPRRPTSP